MSGSLNALVQSMIDEFVASGEEVGLLVAVYHEGKQVVDAWAGIADETTGRPVDGDTLFTCWSTTKGFAATCLHILADRGLIDYDRPVAAYWPEFGANGKAGITVRHALTHQAGVPQLPVDVTPEMMTDWDAMTAAIAGHAPLWTPGTQGGYHAWTFGWIVGEIVRRVDGRPLAQFSREELCRPLGITDFYLGIPDSVEPRVARLREEPAQVQNTRSGSPLALKVMPPHVTSAEIVNRPDFRRASIPGGGGIMNARAIARHYAMLAGYGELDGVRILSPERIDLIRACQIDSVDAVSGARACRSLGYGLGGDPAAGGSAAMGSPNVFGHGGYGGSLGFADPERRLAFGLAKTLLKAAPDPTQTIACRLADAVRAHLG